MGFFSSKISSQSNGGNGVRKKAGDAILNSAKTDS